MAELEVWNHGRTQRIPWEDGKNLELLANSGIHTEDIDLAGHVEKFDKISVKEIEPEKWKITELNKRARQIGVWEFGLTIPELVERIIGRAS